MQFFYVIYITFGIWVLSNLGLSLPDGFRVKHLLGIIVFPVSAIILLIGFGFFQLYLSLENFCISSKDRPSKFKSLLETPVFTKKGK